MRGQDSEQTEGKHQQGKLCGAEPKNNRREKNSTGHGTGAQISDIER
jgi:hypothetical protein